MTPAPAAADEPLDPALRALIEALARRQARLDYAARFTEPAAPER